MCEHRLYYDLERSTDAQTSGVRSQAARRGGEEAIRAHYARYYMMGGRGLGTRLPCDEIL